jgi:hypothetical protein
LLGKGSYKRRNIGMMRVPEGRKKRKERVIKR